MLCCVCIVVVLTGALCREEVKEFQKFRVCEKNMVFVALFMKNWYLKIVEAEHPVWAIQETKELYGHIVKEYKDCIPEKRPADTFNRPSKYFEKLYAHTWDFRWQYAVMTSINDFIRAKSGREQQPTQDKWIAYLRKAVEVYDEYVKKPTDIHELWVFRPYENQIAFVADLMKNIESKNVNVVNTPFDLFGLYKTNLLYNMIMVLCVRDQFGQFKDHSLDNRWKWAVMKVILHDSESRKTEKFRHKALNGWFEYLNAAYTHANRVPDEFQKFSPYEREIAFVAKYMQGMSGNHKTYKIRNKELKLEEVEKLIDNLYDKTIHKFYDNLLREKQRIINEKQLNQEIIDNYTLQYTWQYALMRTINIYSVVNHVEDPEKIAYWVDDIQKAYLLEYPDAILTQPAKAAGPGPAGAKQGSTAPAKVAEPVVEAPPAVDESPIQENEKFQKFKPCKKEMIFVADVMKKIHLKEVGVENLALFGKAKTNVLYDLITRLYSDEVAENLPQTSILYTHPLDYRWQFVLMKAINYQVEVQGASSEEWITYLRESYEYANRTSREFSTFIPHKEKVVFVADFMKRMSVTKPKDDDPVLKLALTQQLFDLIQKKYKKLLENGVNTDTLEYTWQYALIETMNELGRMFLEDKLFKKPSLLKYLDEAYKLSHPSATPTPASGGGNAAANADIPKLALPSVSPPVSEASEDDVKSDAEESDVDGAGQDIGTAPGTPADTNFTPESTPPPNPKAENDRPKSAPQQRTVKEKDTAQDLVSGRHRGFETARDKKRSEVYNKNRIQKPDGKDGPAADAAPADGGVAAAKSTSKKRSSEESAESVETLDLSTKRHVKYRKQPTDLALAVIKENAAAEPVAGAVEPVARGGGRTILLPPSIKDKNPDGSTKFKISEQKRTLYKLAYRWKPYRKNIEALASRVRELMKLPPNELKKQIANMNDLISVICMYFHHCYHNPVYQKYLRDNFKDPALRYEFMVIELMSGAGNTTDKDGTDEKLTFIAPEEWIQLLKEFGNTQTSKIEESQHESFSKKHHASIIELKKMYEEREKQRKQEASKRKIDTQGDVKEDTKVEDKRPRTGQTLEEFTRVLMFTEEEERDMLYVQNENWRKYSAQITKLTQYIKKFTDEPGTIFTREEYNVFLDNNPKTKLLIEYFQKYIQSNDVTDDQVMDVFHFASIQNESIIVDAINFVISYEDNVDEWEAFLRMTPEDLDTKDIKLAPGIGSKLNTFPADASPLIYNLTRRLEALQDW